MMGMAVTLGAITATYIIEIGEPWIAFLISFVVCLLSSIQGCFMADKLETDEFATGKDFKMIMHQMRKKEGEVNSGQDLEQNKKPGFFL